MYQIMKKYEGIKRTYLLHEVDKWVLFDVH